MTLINNKIDSLLLGNDSRRITFKEDIEPQMTILELTRSFIGCAVIDIADNETYFIHKCNYTIRQPFLSTNYSAEMIEFELNNGEVLKSRRVKFYKNDETDETESVYDRIKSVKQDWLLRKKSKNVILDYAPPILRADYSQALAENMREEYKKGTTFINDIIEKSLADYTSITKSLKKVLVVYTPDLEFPDINVYVVFEDKDIIINPKPKFEEKDNKYFYTYNYSDIIVTIFEKHIPLTSPNLKFYYNKKEFDFKGILDLHNSGSIT